MKASALYHSNSKHSEIRQLDIEPSDDLVVLESQFSMISTGTELKVAEGKIGSDFNKTMAVPYMDGQFNLPIKYGYSMVAKVSTSKKMVHLLHPHQNICLVNQSDLFEIPNDVSPLRATLASNMETVVNAIWDSEISQNSTALICGFGNIGALLAETLRLYFKATVIVAEQNIWRLAKAKELGFLTEITQPADVAFNTSGAEMGLQYCIDKVGKEGKIIELSWYGNKKVSLELGKSFHYHRKQLISSQVSTIPKNKQVDWDFKKRKQYVFDLLKNEAYDQYISGIIPFKDSPQFFNQLRNNPTPEGLIWCIEY